MLACFSWFLSLSLFLACLPAFLLVPKDITNSSTPPFPSFHALINPTQHIMIPPQATSQQLIQSIRSSIHQLTNWLSDWLIAWLIDWLIDCTAPLSPSIHILVHKGFPFLPFLRFHKVAASFAQPNHPSIPSIHPRTPLSSYLWWIRKRKKKNNASKIIRTQQTRKDVGLWRASAQSRKTSQDRKERQSPCILPKNPKVVRSARLSICTRKFCCKCQVYPFIIIMFHPSTLLNRLKKAWHHFLCMSPTPIAHNSPQPLSLL